MLDTDHISVLQKQSGAEYLTLSTRIAQHPVADFAYCVISFHEQALGCHAYVNRARSSAELVRGYRMFFRILRDFTASQVLPFDAIAANAYDGFAPQKLRVASMDLRIAAIAIANSLVLLTRNAVDFASSRAEHR